MQHILVCFFCEILFYFLCFTFIYCSKKAEVQVINTVSGTGVHKSFDSDEEESTCVSL